MVADFSTWLDELLAYCELDIPAALKNSLIEDNERQRPRGEDVRKHVRKGQPGDYLEKLKPETIDYLNDRFAAALQTFGYTESSPQTTTAL